LHGRKVFLVIPDDGYLFKAENPLVKLYQALQQIIDLHLHDNRLRTPGELQVSYDQLADPDQSGKAGGAGYHELAAHREDQ